MNRLKNSFISKAFSSVLILLMLLGNYQSYAIGNVSPDVNEHLAIGESYYTVKNVTTPEIPPKVDIMFLFDSSGSFGDDLPNIKGISDSLYDDIAASGSDFRLAVSSFIDYPVFPFGDPGIAYPFKLEQDFTSDKATWTGAVDNLIAVDGNDLPESQYDALVGSSQTGSWRPDAKRIIVIATDASFHNPGEPGYPGVNGSGSTISALNDAGITVIGLQGPFVPGDESTQLLDIANATGGEVLPIDETSSNIASAILEGLGNLDITVIPDASACSPLDITFSPDSMTVTSGDVASFDETITVPDDPSLGGTTVSCEVSFNDEDGNLIGVQLVNIEIPDTTAPYLECNPTVNPAGKNTPKAGEKSTGQNEDGFYQLFAEDNVDESPEIYVNGFGPFDSLDNVKITEAPGATPSLKKIGNDTDDVIYHLILDSDAVVTAVDDSGNVSEPVSCLVAPLPK